MSISCRRTRLTTRPAASGWKRAVRLGHLAEDSFMPDEILRTFITIELEEPLRIAIARVQGKFKRQAPPGSVKWVAPEGIHLTLKFLGDTPPGRWARSRPASGSPARPARRSSAWKDTAAFPTHGGHTSCGWQCETRAKCFRGSTRQSNTTSRRPGLADGPRLLATSDTGPRR